MRLTRSELKALARERFGDDPLGWAFVCPHCGDVATARDFEDSPSENPHLVGQECIGRSLGALDAGERYEGRGCNWAAYGLIPGPWEVVLPNGESMRTFALADKTTPP